MRFTCADRLARLPVALCTWLLVQASMVFLGDLVAAQGVAAIQNVTSRPFVTGITPIIGSRGAVGGVLIDAQGVVRRVDSTDGGALRDRWRSVFDSVGSDVRSETDFRVISLAGLDRALANQIDSEKPLTAEMIFLAGLRRVEYVVAVPMNNDVLLAGPAGPCRVNDAGEVVGESDGRAVLRLDDLMDAFHAARQTIGGQISCSIEPTAQGQQQYARVRARLRRFSRPAVQALEQAIGSQQVLIDGVAKDSHFAHVMLSADYLMKRLAMGLDPSPVDGLPSYLQMLRKQPAGLQVTSPRWWLASHYDPLRCTADRLVWRIDGQAVRAMTQDSILTDTGNRRTLDKENTLAQQWSDALTKCYPELSHEMPVFGELRNCFDLAVVGALIASEGLDVRSDCQFEVLSNPGRLRGSRMNVAKSIPSNASLVKGQSGWIVCVSGGVKMDAWAVVEKPVVDEALSSIKTKAVQRPDGRTSEQWWW